MIKLENLDVFGWETAIRGMRNPMNSWGISDSCWEYVNRLDAANCTGRCVPECTSHKYVIGNADLSLMEKLIASGSDHRKFMRMILVSLDITAPQYWWNEYDTYKVGTVANSCSKMHKIHDRDLTLADFSHEHLFTSPESIERGKLVLESLIGIINWHRQQFVATKDKDHWWQVIQLLPMSYNHKRTVLLNYEVLRNMYHARKEHKLDEWRQFCDWIKTLPHAHLITGKDGAK